MPSKTQHKIQFADKRGVYVGFIEFPKSMAEKTGWYVVDDRQFVLTGWGDLSPAHHGPYISKRQAKNVAYSLAVGK